MKNKMEIHEMLMANQEAIIQKDKQDIPILKIAQEYGVVSTTIYTLLKKWGVRKRDFARYHFKCPKDQKTEKEEKFIAFEKTLSPELLAKRKENTRINNKYIKFYRTVETAHDRFLVQEVLRKSEVGNE